MSKEIILTTVPLEQLEELISNAMFHAFRTHPQSLFIDGEEEVMLTRKEIQKRYKVSLGTIHNLMNSGRLKYTKIGRKTLFQLSDIEVAFSSKKLRQ